MGSDARECGGGACPPGFRCAEAEDAPLCVPASCGNGRVDGDGFTGAASAVRWAMKRRRRLTAASS